MARTWYSRYGKRCCDVLIAAPACGLLSPLFLLAAVLVRRDSPGPALFVQERAGRHGRTFRIFKFRTMTDRLRTPDREIIGRDAEVTRVGFWLRRFKIDELPQLWNVVRGDMSLIGPRPWLPSAWAECDAAARRRFDVRPGLTGLAQVHGNIHLSREERTTYDVRYVDELSAGLDLRILWKTSVVVLAGEERFLEPPKRPDAVVMSKANGPANAGRGLPARQTSAAPRGDQEFAHQWEFVNLFAQTPGVTITNSRLCEKCVESDPHPE
jgi:lipopolysaccharide/colanic/teichoic acid biosynthesis glycosyltransferase